MGERTRLGGPAAVGVIAALAAAVVVVGIITWVRVGPPANPTGDSVAELRDFQQLAVEHPNQALAQCERSQPTMFAGLAASLADDDDSFGTDRFEYRKDGLVYLSANLRNGDNEVTIPTPVWVYGGSGYAALSQSAVRASVQTPDARTIYQANPYGHAATRVKTCVLAAGRAAQLGR